MGTQAVDFGPPPAKPQAVDFGPPPNQSQAVDFGPPPSRPGLLSRLGGTLERAGEAVKQAVVPTAADLANPANAVTPLGPFAGPASRLLTGMAKQTASDVGTLARFGLGDFAPQYSPTLRQGAAAGLRTGLMAGGAGVLGRGVGAVAGRVLPEALAAPVARVATGAATGAAFNPSDPAVGAIVGGGLGAAPETRAPEFAQNPTLPEALSPTVNETLAPSATARAVRSGLNRPGPVAAPRPAEPVDAFMQWSAAAEDPALSPEVRAHAAAQAAAAKPAADAVYAERAAMPFPEESNAPIDFGPPPSEGFTFGHEGLVSPERAPETPNTPEPPGVRYASGQVRKNLSGVSDEALYDEMYRLHSNNASDHHAFSELVYPEEATGIERGYSMQSGMQSRLDNRNKTIAKIEAELQRRGHTREQMIDGLYEAGQRSDAPEPGSEIVGGAEASPTELQEMFSGPGVTAPVRKQLHHVYQSGFVDVNTLLDQPQDQALKGNMQEGGAAQTYGDALARYGVGSARAAIPDEKVPLVEAQINADNALARADAREKAGLTEDAANLRAHAANYQSIAGPDIRQDPDFGKYVNRFNEVVTPHLRRLAIQGGLPEERLLSIPNGSPYVPMAADIEKAPPTPVLAPNIPRRPGTKLSSATERATGGAQGYLNDIEEQVRGVAASRQKIAAENQLWQNVKNSGRPVPKDADLEPGEVRVAFTDKNQITTPNSPNATQYVAVPQRVATSVSDYLARNAPAGSGGSMFSRGLRFARSAMTKGAIKVAPIMTKVHGYNILSTVGQVPSESVAGNIAASLPFGSPIAGAAGLYGIDFADPAVASAMIEHARYGGTHPIETGLGSRALFGAQGLDARGRYVLGERRKALYPDETPAQRAQYLTETLGNYNPANQPGFIRGGQATGATTFAPAGVAFTRSAVRRTLPIFPGMTPGERLATLGRTLGSAVGTAEALNYANTGHSTFSNEPGHRLDIDRGSKNDQNQENYIRFGALFPMVDRGLRMTGVRPFIEGQGIGGIARAPINEALAQTGIPLRAAGAAFLNIQPRLGPNLVPVLATPPEFNLGKMLPNMAARGFLGSLGAASAIAGTNPFDADRSFGQRAADALGLNFGTQGTRGGKTPIPSGYDDKVQTEIFRVYDAKSMADKRAVIQSAVKDATAAGYPAWMIQKMRIQLLKAAAKSAPHAAP